MDEFEARVRDVMVAHEHEAPSGDRLRLSHAPRSVSSRWRLRGWVGVAAVVVTVAAISAGGLLIYQSASPRHTASGGLPTCGSAPTPRGNDAGKIELTLRAPASATRGTTIQVAREVHSLTGKAEYVVGENESAAGIVIVQDGKVVGKYRGGVAGFEVGISAPPRGVAALPAARVLLSGCPTGPVDDAHPDASRKPLPPGHYELVGTFANRVTTYVSRPATIQVY
jgi:hypothetical protein